MLIRVRSIVITSAIIELAWLKKEEEEEERKKEDG